MSLSSGRLKDRIRLESPSVTVNAETGQPDDTWVLVADRRADIEPLKSSERVLPSGEVGMVTVKITLRYDQSLAAIDYTWRVTDRDSGQVFDIHSVINVAQMNRTLELLCEERSR